MALGIALIQSHSAGEECTLNSLIEIVSTANRVLARDSKSRNRQLPHLALTALCAIVIHRDSGRNEKVKSRSKTRICNA